MNDLELEMHRSIDELGKFSVNIKIDSDQVLDTDELHGVLSDIVMDSTKECFERGADLIGHVKACAYNEGGDENLRMLNANLTSFKNGVVLRDRMEGDHFQKGYVMLHVIVHGIWDPDVRDASLAEIDRIMKERGMEYRIIRDFFESEKRVKC